MTKSSTFGLKGFFGVSIIIIFDEAYIQCTSEGNLQSYRLRIIFDGDLCQ